MSVLKKILAIFITAIDLFAVVVLDFPSVLNGTPLDRAAFTAEPVWADEFDGTELDTTKWKDHHTSKEAGLNVTTIRRGGYWNPQMAQVADGNLTIRTEYLEEGLGGGPAGYYTCGLDTNGLFEKAHGYFEIRCKLPKGQGHWAAFWMLNDGMSNVDGSGRDGAEIDIFESPYYYFRK